MRQPLRGGQVTLKHINRAGTWPSGNARLYYRPKGKKGIGLPDLPIDHPKFLIAYAEAAGLTRIPEAPARTGSIAAAIHAFLASDRFLGVSSSTRAVWRRGLMDMRDRYGRGNLADLEDIHIRKDLARLTANPARQRLKIWRAFLGWCVDAGLLRTDPTTTIRQRPAPKSTGHQTWTRDDLKAFRDHWAVGTEQRLAAEIIAWTGARMSDVVRLGDGHIGRDGWLRFRQQKTGGEVAIPMIDAPVYAEHDGLLAQCLTARPARGLVWLTTAAGAARSQKSTSQWFSAACRKAGLSTSLTAHGLRKYRATIMRENGATAAQRAAWLGHESDRQESEYSRTADKLRLIMGTDEERKVPTPDTSSNSVRQQA